MINNYLKTAFRSLLRKKGHSFINIIGLSLGLACCLIIFQFVAFEYSFDDFHTKKDRIYRPAFKQIRNGEDRGYSPQVGVRFAPTMASEVPGIARYTRVHPNYGDAVVSYGGAGEDRVFTETDVLFVDSTYLSIFDFPLVKGSRSAALRHPQTMLISASTARKYFGSEEPLGKQLRFTGWVDGMYTVTGVFEDVPPTSHLRFDFLIPIYDLLKDGSFERGGSAWGWQNFVTYFEVEPTADVAAMETKITETYRKYRAEEFTTNGIKSIAYLQPLRDIHLNKEIQGAGAVTGDRKTVYFFTLIGLVTLIIALVNYVNLATARAMDRAREVGVRKVVGAHRSQLIGQFLTESALMNVLAFACAIVLSLLLLPMVNRVAEVELTRDLWLDVRFWTVFLGIFGLGVVLSGLYPSFILSSFRPVLVLKGNAGTSRARLTLRKVLVVVQFAASIALLVGTAIVVAQLNYMKGLDTGLDLEKVLVVEEPQVVHQAEGEDIGTRMAALKSELRNIPSVRTVGMSSTTPGRGFQWYTSSLYRATADPTTGKPAQVTGIDPDFATVYGLELVAGQPFPEGMAMPDGGDQPVMVNETLVREVGFASNEEAIDGRISTGDGNEFIIRGVYKDFRWSSAHQRAEAAVLRYETRGGNISMKVDPKDLPGTIAAAKKVYERLFPGNPFEYYFADAAFDEQYRAEQRFAMLFGIFAALAIFIACLGLFGLASFTARKRTKEIGLRKVLGASAVGIVALLSRDFLKLVALSVLVASPLAYFAMRRWLEGFAYRIDLGPGVFLLAGALALLIALLTVSYQAVRAALADPVDSLRYE